MVHYTRHHLPFRVRSDSDRSSSDTHDDQPPPPQTLVLTADQPARKAKAEEDEVDFEPLEADKEQEREDEEEDDSDDEESESEPTIAMPRLDRKAPTSARVPLRLPADLPANYSDLPVGDRVLIRHEAQKEAADDGMSDVEEEDLAAEAAAYVHTKGSSGDGSSRRRRSKQSRSLKW